MSLSFTGKGSGSAYYNINDLSIRIDNPNGDSISYIDITFDAFISNSGSAGNVTIGFLIDGTYCTEKIYYISASTKNFSASIPFTNIRSKNDSYYTLTFAIYTNKAGNVPYFLNVSYSDHGTLVTSYNNTIEYYVDGFEAGSDTQSGPDTSSSFTLFDLPDDIYTRDTSWESAFTITGKANGGVEDTSCQAQLKEHYYCYYDGWFLNSIYGERVNPGETYTLSNGTALYATIDDGYEPEYQYNTLASLPKPTRTDITTYTVTFDPNGGSVSASSKTATATKTTPYTFKHWSSTASGGTAYKETQAFTSATTVYAQWTAQTPSTTTVTDFPTPTKSEISSSRIVTFNTNGGSCSMNTATSTNTTYYRFKGWYSAASGGSEYEQITPTSNTTLYAQWTPDPTGYSAITLPDATKAGYSFSGWYDQSASKVYTAGQQIIPTDDITLTALWSASTYEVKYNGNGHTDGSMNNSSHTIGSASELSPNDYVKEYTLSFDVGYSQSLLPNEYIQLDYVQSNASQAIDTEHYQTSEKMRIESQFMILENSTWDAIWGCEETNSGPWALTMLMNSASPFTLGIYSGNSSNVGAIPIEINTIHTMDCQTDNGTITYLCDNNSGTLYSNGSLCKTDSMYLFTLNSAKDSAIIDQASKMRIYYFKIYDNDILKKHFIPCKRKSDNIAGLYDLVNKKFHKSFTENDLIAGNQISDNNTEIINDQKISYAFQGWYSNSSCTGDPITQAYDLTTAGKIYNVYAKWIQNDFTLPIPKREGYIFLGWYDSQGSHITNNFQIASDLSLTAQWIKNESNKKIIIYTNNDWKKAIALIYKNNTWKEYDFNIK